MSDGRPPVTPLDARDLYQVAVDTRRLEITLFWQRSNYFLALNTALAVGLFTVGDSSYTVLLAIIGFVTCSLWVAVNLGSKYWQSRWEQRAHELELEVKPEANLFGADKDKIQSDVERSTPRSGRTHLATKTDLQTGPAKTLCQLHDDFVVRILHVRMADNDR